MAISNSASGFRPGVCTSTTRPTAPFDGQVIYETDTKQTLVWQGSAWVMLTDADQPPGLQLIKTQTVGTAVSSVTVNDAFSSDFENYKITYTNGTASGNGNIRMTLGATNSGYYSNLAIIGYSNTPTQSLNGLAPSSYFDWVGTYDTNGNYINADIFQPNLARRTAVNGVFIGLSSTRGSGNMQGFVDNNTQYTSFTITLPSGTMTGGTIRVYGYRN